MHVADRGRRTRRQPEGVGTLRRFNKEFVNMPTNAEKTAKWRNGPNGVRRKTLRGIDYMPPKELIATRDRARVQMADKLGFARPVPESVCPPRPTDGLCQCCGEDIGESLLVLDHDHDFGHFLGWVCKPCNTIGDNIAKLQARVAYLTARFLTPARC
jgi:hypothetical protein